jgi:hypothetical protein
MNIKLFQMLTGDLIIGELIDDGMLSVTIMNPLRVIVMQSQNRNSPSIALAPWCEFTDDKEFTFNKSHVINIMEPVQQFTNQYQQTFSKLITPQPKLLLPGA